MPIVFGIDGTGGGWWPGEARNARYDAGFRKSFVTSILNGAKAANGCASVHGAHALYQRGPATLGATLRAAIDAGTSFIQTLQAAHPKEPVLLTGYSRGGAGVIVVAQNLERLGIPVRAMLLFDAVDRAANIDAYALPNNVEHAFHVLRSWSAKSRESFENCGYKKYWAGKKTVYRERHYRATHGAMGGVPWIASEDDKLGSDFIDEGFAPYMKGWSVKSDGLTRVTYDQDRAVSIDISNEIRPFLLQHGFVKSWTWSPLQ